MKEDQYLLRLFVVVLVSASSLMVAAQPTPGSTNTPPPLISVDDMVAEALEKNSEHAFYRGEIAAAKAERQQAGAFPNPEFSVEGGRKRSREAGGAFAGEGMAWTVSVAQPLDFPGRISLRKAIANRQIELAELGLRQFEATLASRIRILAVQVYAAQAQAEAADEIATRSQELIQTLVQRDPAGITPLLETRLIEASIITYSKRATEAVTLAKTLQGELNVLRGRSVDSLVRISPPTVDLPQVPPVETLVERALTNNFDVRSQQIELAQQGLRIDLARKDRWKEVTVAPFYSQEKAGDRESIVGVGLSIPVPIWNRNSGNIKSAEARQQQAEVAVRLVQRRVERELRAHFTAYNARLGQMSRWTPDTLGLFQEAAELADRHYRLGAVPITTYVELQEKYLEAQEVILNTQAQALEDLHQLSLSTGDISLSTKPSNP